MIKFLDLKGITDKYADEIQQAVQGVVSSGWYLQGKANAAFEEHYAEYIGTRYCVGVANGLDALTLTYRAYMEMGIMHEGDEVIVPANTYIASILAITENGLKPVLVEPDINTLEMDDSLIEQYITSRTRSMMTVHLYGRCAYTERIGRLCKKYNLEAGGGQCTGSWMPIYGQEDGFAGRCCRTQFLPYQKLRGFGRCRSRHHQRQGAWPTAYEPLPIMVLRVNTSSNTRAATVVWTKSRLLSSM